MLLAKTPAAASLCAWITVCSFGFCVPAWGAELVARTSFEDGFELPARSDFSNDPVILNDRGEVAAVLTAAEGRLIGAVWLKTADGVKIVYGKAGEYLLRDLRFTSLGQLVFEQVNPEFESEGVFVADPMSGVTTRKVAPGGALGTEFFGAPHVTPDGRVGYHSKTLKGPSLFAWDSAGAVTSIVAATWPSPRSEGYSYLFMPEINDHLDFVSKVRLGATPKDLDESQPDEIRLWRADGSSILIARDRDADAASFFTGFDNGVALSQNGIAAFVANSADGTRAVWLWQGGGLHKVASIGDAGLSEISLFHVVVNDAGRVAFRGKDIAGRAAVFSATTSGGLIRLVTEGDLLPSDLGPARLAPGDPTDTALAGGLSINAAGSVVFRGKTVAREGSAHPIWSTAIYQVRTESYIGRL